MKITINTLHKLMGESCEEGGPFPSHKIPQRTIKLKRSKGNFIHLSKEMIHYKWSLAPVLSKTMFSCSFKLPSNDDVSSF